MSRHSMDHFRTGESVAIIAVTRFLSYLAVKQLPEKRNKAKQMWRSILEIRIRTNPQTDCGVIQLAGTCQSSSAEAN